MGGQSPNTHLDSAVSSGCQHSPPLVPGELPCSAECWPKVQQTNTNPLTQGIWTPRRTYWKFEKEMLLMYLPHIHQWPAWASSLPSLSSFLSTPILSKVASWTQHKPPYPFSAFIFSAKQPTSFLWCTAPLDIIVFRASLVTPVIHQSYFLKKKKSPFSWSIWYSC